MAKTEDKMSKKGKDKEMSADPKSEKPAASPELSANKLSSGGQETTSS